MPDCPACGADLVHDQDECWSCGIVVSKWRERSERPPPLPVQSAPAEASEPSTPSTPTTRKVPVALVIGAVVLVTAVAVFLLLRGKSESNAVTRPERADQAPAGQEIEEISTSFDLQRKLDASPLGMTFRDADMILTNRLEPWGLVIVRHQGEQLEQTAQPVTESTSNQRIILNTITWNGSHLVGISMGSWVDATTEDVFVALDPESLAIKWWYPAPPRIGALVWDGDGYWAATRRTTESAREPAYLYRIDTDLEVVDRYPPPAVGCQGLAVNENLLYFADVFTGTVTVLDTSVRPPRVVERLDTGLEDLSGVGYDGDRLWVVEYGSDRLLRLDLQTLASTPRPAVRNPTPPEPPADEAATLTGKESLRELYAMLRSDDNLERMQAENELLRRGKVPDFDREEERFSVSGPEDVSIRWWQAEMKRGTITASWEIFFGSGLFSEDAEHRDGPVTLPLFARYSIEIAGGELEQPMILDLEGRPGVQTLTDQVLATGLGHGTYRLNLFVHVQYVQPQGGAKILDTSAFPLEVGW